VVETTAAATLFHEADVETHDLRDVPRHIGRSSLLWLDVGRGEDELESVAGLVDLDPATVALVRDGNRLPSFDDRPSYSHVTTRVPEKAAADADLDQIDCIVGKRWVVTVHDRPIAVLEEFRKRADGSGAIGRLDGPAFLATLLEWIVGEYAAAFDAVEAELEELDVRALAGAPNDPEVELRRLVALRRDLGGLHRCLSAHREPLTALTHPELDALASEESARRFRALLDRFDVTVQAGRDTRASIVASFDVLMARTEHQTNQILKVLTLFSVLFLPGALIAGVLGMNFKASIFEHASLFWVVLGGILAMIVWALAMSRRRGWV
jgi:magnesium transporter